jgi:hypothetical protein
MKYSSSGEFILQIVINIGFYLLINTICINIFFGIIVDTFSELRDQKLKEGIIN